MLLIMSLFLLIIIRVVRSDLSRYLQIPDEELNAVEEETGPPAPGLLDVRGGGTLGGDVLAEGRSARCRVPGRESAESESGPREGFGSRRARARGGCRPSSGWKLLHADCFRPPKHRLFFCAAIGSGAQLFSMVMMIVLVGCVGVFYQCGA